MYYSRRQGPTSTAITGLCSTSAGRRSGATPAARPPCFASACTTCARPAERQSEHSGALCCHLNSFKMTSLRDHTRMPCPPKQRHGACLACMMYHGAARVTPETNCPPENSRSGCRVCSNGQHGAMCIRRKCSWCTTTQSSPCKHEGTCCCCAGSSGASSASARSAGAGEPSPLAARPLPRTGGCSQHSSPGNGASTGGGRALGAAGTQHVLARAMCSRLGCSVVPHGTVHKGRFAAPSLPVRRLAAYPGSASGTLQIPLQARCRPCAKSLTRCGRQCRRTQAAGGVLCRGQPCWEKRTPAEQRGSPAPAALSGVKPATQ